MSVYTDCDFPGGLEGKASSCNVGDLGSIPGLGRSPGSPCSSSLILGNILVTMSSSAAAAKVTSVLSDSVRPHRWQPTRLPRLWDSLGKNTGVGCHFLLQCMKWKSESEVTQLCPTLSDPMDCSLPGSSVHGIFQARVLEWGAIAFSYYYTTKKLKSKFHL